MALYLVRRPSPPFRLSPFTDAILHQQENIPTIPSSHSLSTFLSALLGSQLQRLILPPLFDPSNPPDVTPSTASEPSSQSTAFAAMKAETSGKEVRRKGRALPSGGGPCRGYAFVVLESREDAERVLREWRWEKGSELEKDEEKMDEDKPADDPASLARRSSFRSLS